MIRNLSITEIVLILLALILLFGARRIPELARSLGKSLSEFKKGRKEGESDDINPDKPDGSPST
ncbi:MAG TPA: twin-arginine translocase TatA/TatE family subunit [Kiritimatiellia bacterium]|nr:twin-arginine translocase TatA/TatE family subunit [Kiritimatiellia bacterium]